MALTPEQRSMRARIAANARWAREDSRAHGGAMARARAAFEARFVDEVDPDRQLSEDDRTRRVRNARAAYYSRLQLASSRARSQHNQEAPS